jgi:hypothetical protein
MKGIRGDVTVSHQKNICWALSLARAFLGFNFLI